jgi:DNA-binding MarR family transcriptional regulator
MRGKSIKVQDLPPGVSFGREFSTSVVLFQEAIASKLGLNATDYRCLELMIRKGQMTAKALAQQVHLTTGAMTGIVDHLEEAGYAERLENPEDRRSIIVSPIMTQTALEEKLGDTLVAYRAAMAKLFSKYNTEQTAVIVDFLREFVRVLEAQTSTLRDTSVR